MKISRFTTLQQGGMLFLLCAVTIALNWQCVAFDMMYLEQPAIYAANQNIHSVYDLLRVYLHPLMLESAVPFFRPSGHFLVYQLMTPFVGWYNTRSLLVVNFLFLGMAGFFLIKLYQLFFPRFRLGGYIAFAFFLMQPATILGRMTVMHFEFAYVSFVLMAWYYFVKFCRQNHLGEVPDTATMQFHSLHLFVLSLSAYFIGVTFKESALMLGPVLITYFLIMVDRGQPLSRYFKTLWQNKSAVQIILIVGISFMVFGLYITSPWPKMHNPLRFDVPSRDMLFAMDEFLKLIFGSRHDIINMHGYQAIINLFGTVITTGLARTVLRTLLLVTVLSAIFAVVKQLYTSTDKKILAVLMIAATIFMILPIGWGAGLPWHFSLTLLCLGLCIGFQLELFITSIVKKPQTATITLALIAAAIALVTLNVNHVNIKRYDGTSAGLAFVLNRNAVYHPPHLALNADSVLVVEDSMDLGDYALGNSSYPLSLFYAKDFAFAQLAWVENSFFLKTTEPTYSGHLFRWGFAKQQLKEEVFPFRIAEMQNVYDYAIRDWLLHFDNIFCVGYDDRGVWYDKTNEFKAKLLAEKQRRHLVINSYQAVAKKLMTGQLAYREELPYADPELCRSTCDKVAVCKGFNFLKVDYKGIAMAKCLYYNSLTPAKNKPCEVCTGFIKETL